MLGQAEDVAASLDEFIIPRTFLAIAVIIVVARLMGMLARRLRQPTVIGEIVGGILLGPTLLGALPGSLDEKLFPLATQPFLKVIANLGLVIFMFIVGMELDLKLIRGKERVAGAISVCSVILPFSLGILLAAILYGDHDMIPGVGEAGGASAVEFIPFALFIGASMSITAFPVLARILADRGMYRTQIGALTLASAAVDDVIAWSLLAIVVAVIDSSGLLDFPLIVGESVIFVILMFVVVKPLLARLGPAYQRIGRLTPDMMAILIVGFLLSAFVTSEIGIHLIFGAFVFGAIMPRKNTHAMLNEVLERFETVSVVLLLPVFFVLTGLNVDVGGLGLGLLASLLLILAVAIGGKVIGASFAARFAGRLSLRKSLAIGTLMNTRGLTELVILTIGREKGVLDDQLFTMLVVMAVVTTIMTEPILRLVYPDRLLQRDIEEASRAAPEVASHRVAVVVEDPTQDGDIVDVATTLTGRDEEHLRSELVLTHVVPSGPPRELGSGIALQLDEMATSMSTMQSLAQRADDVGVRCVVRSHFSDDVVTEVLREIEAIDADLVLVRGRPGELGLVGSRLLADASCDVGVVYPATELRAGRRRISVVVEPGRDVVAAVELAARAARDRDTVVQLVDHGAGGRRLSRLVRQLADMSLQTAVDRPTAPLETALLRERDELSLREVDGAAAIGQGQWPLIVLTSRQRDSIDRETAALTTRIAATVVVVRAREGTDDARLDTLTRAIRDAADAGAAQDNGADARAAQDTTV